MLGKEIYLIEKQTFTLQKEEAGLVNIQMKKLLKFLIKEQSRLRLERENIIHFSVNYLVLETVYQLENITMIVLETLQQKI